MKRGRKSEAERAMAPIMVAHEPVLVQPPRSLSEPARKVFLDLVRALIRPISSRATSACFASIARPRLWPSGLRLSSRGVKARPVAGRDQDNEGLGATLAAFPTEPAREGQG